MLIIFGHWPKCDRSRRLSHHKEKGPMHQRFTALMLFLGCTVATPLQAVTIQFNPSKDNTIIQTTSASAQLSNGTGDLFVGRTNQDGQGPATISIRRGLLEFNLAAPGIGGLSIPAGATITGVTLTMRDVMGLNG